ncbi:arginase family protein [Anaeromyxobacter sp. PSR-1]|uniref:arginase family protein n=1 Tax=unclassified Anaeromyxobacter TaxID=2620896 RepID=UPI0005DAAE51|nr:arginase family protein [Anaeromyxobacter sp. PSR-1]GAO04021.1 agmatinase [Anaeromyxobacter sp. PSR-1]
MNLTDTLALLLRPAGGGIHLVSSGKSEQLALQRRLYGADDEAEIRARWREDLERAATARAVVLGIPSDVGAGFRRGANLGPAAIRERLLEDDPSRSARDRADGVVDLGDVFVVPQLLHDDMLGEAQLAASRRALYPDLPAEEAALLPVSPLSIAERALALVLEANPRARVFAVGGDHSTAWPVVKALAPRWPGMGIVQIDAHTDLLEDRLGIRYCFGTWSYHANELVGRGGRLVQVGTRASGRDRAHWESTLGVRQFWAADVLADPRAALDQILAHVKATGVSSVYFSNDIDGTDQEWADATGTPEPGGLTPAFVSSLVRRLGSEVGLAGGDVMEVAPGIVGGEGAGPRTVGLAAGYLAETIDAALGRTR